MKTKTKKIGIILLIAGIIIYGVKVVVDLSFDGTNKIIIIEHFDKIQNIEELINKKEFKNKVLYIDMWGVYCSPCIYEFKFMPDLKKQLADEDIAFIYLATRYDAFDDLQVWKSAIKKYNLEGFNLLVDNEKFFDKIWDDIEGMKNRQAIPHYILVDKNGNIANPNAPRPSSKEELLKEIQKIL